MNIATQLSITALATSLVFAGCSKKEETPGMSRIEGLPTAEETTASMPEVNPAPSSMAGPLPEAGPMQPHGGDMSTSGGAPPMIQAGETKVMAGGNILQAAGLAFTVDDAWKNVKPSSAMRIAQYQLEGSGGPAEMAIFYFGPGQGGGIEDNIKRWAGQFTPDSASTTETAGAQVARLEKEGGLRLALVKTEGTFDPGSMMPGQAASGPKPDYALFGLVVEGGPEGSLFVKVTGPKATLAEQDKALEIFAQSVRVSGYK
jgi:hypothetical protein